MSESKVPLPHDPDHSGPGGSEVADYYPSEVRRYGDARAAEARRLALDVDKVQAFERNVRADERRKALLNFQRIIEQEAEDDQTAIRMMERLRALANEASPK